MLDKNDEKPEVLRRQVVPVPTPAAPGLPTLDGWDSIERMYDDIQPAAPKRPKRLGTWMFMRCSSLRAACLRLDGVRGNEHRISMLAEMEQVHRELGARIPVAVLAPEGVVVATFFGGGDSRNTPIEHDAYLLSIAASIPEHLVPLRKREAADKHDGLLPLAARTDRPPF